MNKLILLLFLAAFVMASNAGSRPPKFPNIGYLGSTYNLFKGNPLSTKGLDPGFTLRNMFHYTYDNDGTTADGFYSVPDGVNAVNSSACSFSFSSAVTKSSSSYTDSLKVGVETSFKGWGASFSASADYKSVQKGTSSSETVFVTSQAKCEAYATTVKKATINPALINAISQLPEASSDLTPYKDFYNHWGTHFARSMRMGGRYGVRSSFSSSDFTAMSFSGLNIEVSAGYSGIVSINANAATSTEKEEARKYESYRKDFQIFQVGGKPPLDDKTTAYEWAQTVRLNPLPVKYDLYPIIDIMTPEHFPDDEHILQKQRNLRNAVVSYCKELGLEDTSLCEMDLPSSEGLIKIHYVDKSKDLCLDKHLVPVVTSTDKYILSTMMDYEGIPDHMSLILVEDSPLLAQATQWKKLIDHNEASILRAVCPTGFSSVADLVCCDTSSINNCLNTVPRNKPCIADKCLVQCGMIEWRRVNSCRPLSYGNIYYGVYYPNYSPLYARFMRYMELDGDDSDQDLAKCLNPNCFEFA